MLLHLLRVKLLDISLGASTAGGIAVIDVVAQQRRKEQCQHGREAAQESTPPSHTNTVYTVYRGVPNCAVPCPVLCIWRRAKVTPPVQGRVLKMLALNA